MTGIGDLPELEEPPPVTPLTGAHLLIHKAARFISMEGPRQRDPWHFRRPRERAHSLPGPPQKAENTNLIGSKGRPRGVPPPPPAAPPAPLGAGSAGFSPDALGLQDEARPLGERAEPHAIDADQALGDRPWGRASCRGQADAVTPWRAAGTPSPRLPWGPTHPPSWRRSSGGSAPDQPHRDPHRGSPRSPPLAAARPHPSPGSWLTLRTWWRSAG